MRETTNPFAEMTLDELGAHPVLDWTRRFGVAALAEDYKGSLSVEVEWFPESENHMVARAAAGEFIRSIWGARFEVGQYLGRTVRNGYDVRRYSAISKQPPAGWVWDRMTAAAEFGHRIPKDFEQVMLGHVEGMK